MAMNSPMPFWLRGVVGPVTPEPNVGIGADVRCPADGFGVAGPIDPDGNGTGCPTLPVGSNSTQPEPGK